MVLLDRGREQHDDAISVRPAGLAAYSAGSYLFTGYRNFSGRRALAGSARCRVFEFCPARYRPGVCNQPGRAHGSGRAVLFPCENPGTADRFSSHSINYLVAALIFIGKIWL